MREFHNYHIYIITSHFYCKIIHITIHTVILYILFALLDRFADLRDLFAFFTLPRRIPPSTPPACPLASTYSSTSTPPACPLASKYSSPYRTAVSIGIPPLRLLLVARPRVRILLGILYNIAKYFFFHSSNTSIERYSNILFTSIITSFIIIEKCLIH